MVKAAAASFVAILSAAPAFAAHPLLTDDTGTQGAAHYQLEVNGGIGWDREPGAAGHETVGQAATAFTAGVADAADVVLTLPFSWTRESGDGTSSGVAGISDVTLETKWRFFSGQHVSLALKPGISFPSGDEKRGLGNGRVSYGATLISTVTLGTVSIHANAGYARNEFSLDSDRDTLRKNILFGSLAGNMEVLKGLQVAGEVFSQSNTESASRTWCSYATAGMIWSLSESLDLDVGVRKGITGPAVDLSLLSGITYRF